MISCIPLCAILNRHLLSFHTADQHNQCLYPVFVRDVWRDTRQNEARDASVANGAWRVVCGARCAKCLMTYDEQVDIA